MSRNDEYIDSEMIHDALINFDAYGTRKAVSLARIMKALDVPDEMERAMRAIIAQMPLCSCAHGHFIPQSKEEILNFREYLRKKAIAMFERWKILRRAYPRIFDDIDQLELFSEEELKAASEK